MTKITLFLCQSVLALQKWLDIDVFFNRLAVDSGGGSLMTEEEVAQERLAWATRERLLQRTTGDGGLINVDYYCY